MSLPLDVVTTEAMALDPPDRLRLAGELIDSVEEPADLPSATSWTEELTRRSAAADAREARGEPRGAEWSEVRARVLQRLVGRRA